MGFYPARFKWDRRAVTDVVGVFNDYYNLVEASLGSPVVDDIDLIVTSANMKVGAYTVAAQPDVPRNITVTHTAVGAADTLGTIVVVGTDRNNEVISETITPLNGTIASGLRAFKTVTSVTGVGWVIGEGNDTIKVGVGGKIGLPDKLRNNRPVQGILNGSLEATMPTLTISATVLSLNTVDFSTGWGGTAATVLYLV
jgi:hypothetical protein